LYVAYRKPQTFTLIFSHICIFRLNVFFYPNASLTLMHQLGASSRSLW